MALYWAAMRAELGYLSEASLQRHLALLSPSSGMETV
jgi:hypothetical protein